MTSTREYLLSFSFFFFFFVRASQGLLRGFLDLEVVPRPERLRCQDVCVLQVVNQQEARGTRKDMKHVILIAINVGGFPSRACGCLF